MHVDRYHALRDGTAEPLTAEELAAGWFFCHCEWDGMLMQNEWEEAKFCHCFKHDKAKL